VTLPRSRPAAGTARKPSMLASCHLRLRWPTCPNCAPPPEGAVAPAQRQPRHGHRIERGLRGRGPGRVMTPRPCRGQLPRRANCTQCAFSTNDDAPTTRRGDAASSGAYSPSTASLCAGRVIGGRGGGPRDFFVMLNPSTGPMAAERPTVERLRTARAGRWRFGAFRVCQHLLPFAQPIALCAAETRPGQARQLRQLLRKRRFGPIASSRLVAPTRASGARRGGCSRLLRPVGQAVVFTWSLTKGRHARAIRFSIALHAGTDALGFDYQLLKPAYLRPSGSGPEPAIPPPVNCHRGRIPLPPEPTASRRCNPSKTITVWPLAPAPRPV